MVPDSVEEVRAAQIVRFFLKPILPKRLKRINNAGIWVPRIIIEVSIVIILGLAHHSHHIVDPRNLKGERNFCIARRDILPKVGGLVWA